MCKVFFNMGRPTRAGDRKSPGKKSNLSYENITVGMATVMPLYNYITSSLVGLSPFPRLRNMFPLTITTKIPCSNVIPGDDINRSTIKKVINDSFCVQTVYEECAIPDHYSEILYYANTREAPRALSFYYLVMTKGNNFPLPFNFS